MTEESERVNALLAAHSGELWARDSYDVALDATKHGETLLATSAAERRIATLEIARHLTADDPDSKRARTSHSYQRTEASTRDTVYRAALRELLRSALPITADDTSLFARALAVDPSLGHMSSFLTSVVNTIERVHGPTAPSPSVAEPLHTVERRLSENPRPDREHRRQLDRIRSLLGIRAPFALDDRDAWAVAMRDELLTLEGDELDHWRALLDAAFACSAPKPTASFWKSVEPHVRALGLNFEARLLRWMKSFDTPESRRNQPHPNNSVVLAGLTWCACLSPTQAMQRAWLQLAVSGFSKLPGIGLRAVKVGNAAIFALGQVATRDAIGLLAVLQTRVKARNALAEIDKALDATARKLGVSKDDIEDIGVPDCGLTEVGYAARSLGDVTVELRLPECGERVDVRFVHANGRSVKSVPAAIKREHAEALTELKTSIKDIERLLPALKKRLDGLYLATRHMDVAAFRERFCDHPLVGALARRLIWTTRISDEEVNFLPRAEGFFDITGARVEPAFDAPVRLWHPIEANSPTVLAWRARLAQLGVVQPFKQAHREIYRLTDAERATRVYSNRFAASLLRQHQFNALCAARGWTNRLRLMVDDSVPPASRTLSAGQLRAEFWVESAGDEYGVHTNEAGVYHVVTTDQVRFYRSDAPQALAHASGGRYETVDDDQPLPLESVSALEFSEIMRDVDLFVGVASVGNDPNWADQGAERHPQVDWNAIAFGELSTLARTRREVLTSVIPLLAIAERCRIDDRFLVVRGDLHSYRIHIGSSNVLIEPDQRYLCIVPNARDSAAREKLFLPFEGDSILSLVLAKATLLANDRAITDPTIVRQLEG